MATNDDKLFTDQMFRTAGLDIPRAYYTWATTSNLKDIDRLRASLIDLGLTGRMLATQDAEEDRVGLMKQLVIHASLGPEPFYQPLLDYWIDKAILDQPVKRRIQGSRCTWSEQNLRDVLHVNTQATTPGSSGSLLTDLPVPGPSTKKRSPLSQTDEEAATQRERKEQAELRKWSLRLFNLFESRDTPTAQQVNHCMNPGRAMLEVTGSTRYRTLKAYVLHWYRFETFLEKAKHKSWPTGTYDYVDYLHFLSEEPCAPSVPESFLLAAGFIEKKSGLPANQVFSSDPLVKAVQRRLTEQLRGPQGPTKRAPRIPSILIEALEGMVLDSTSANYIRGVAWLRLVKVWCSLRYSCHNYLSPARLSMFEGELYGVLKKTKTTGPAKRIRELPIHISRQAYVRFPSWLSVGFELWLTLAPFERDFFLPKMAAGGSQTIREMATYTDAAAAGISVLSKLLLPGTDSLLLDVNWCNFFTEHSERPTLTTALAVLQHSKDERDLVGRWKPEGSDVYVRTYHAIVGRLQATVAEAMRSTNRFEILQEKEIAKAFRDWCTDRLQLKKEEAEAMAETFADILRKPPLSSNDPQGAAPIPIQIDLTETIPSPPSEDDSSEDPDPNSWFLSKSRPEEAFLIIRSGKHSRLHRTNGCWTARYRAVKCPQFCQKEPSTSEYDFRCRICWPVELQSQELSSQGGSSEAEEDPESEREEHQVGSPEPLIVGDRFDQASNWSITES